MLGYFFLRLLSRLVALFTSCGMVTHPWTFVLKLRGRGIIQLGLLLLIATPVARVALSIFGFAKERDRMYVVFTLIVFSILLYSLIGSA